MQLGIGGDHRAALARELAPVLAEEAGRGSECDKAPAASVLHAVAEEGIATRDIAAALGSALGLPVASIPPERVQEHFDWLGMFFGVDVPASNARTREFLGWDPQHPGLLADIAAGHYPGD